MFHIPEGLYYSVGEVAAIYGVSLSTASNWICKGLIPGVIRLNANRGPHGYLYLIPVESIHRDGEWVFVPKQTWKHRVPMGVPSANTMNRIRNHDLGGLSVHPLVGPPKLF